MSAVIFIMTLDCHKQAKYYYSGQETDQHSSDIDENEK